MFVWKIRNVVSDIFLDIIVKAAQAININIGIRYRQNFSVSSNLIDLPGHTKRRHGRKICYGEIYCRQLNSLNSIRYVTLQR